MSTPLSLHGKVPELYFFSTGQGTAQPITHFVPLGEAALKAKAAASALHRSQYSEPPLDGWRWVGQKVAASIGRDGWAEGFQAFF